MSDPSSSDDRASSTGEPGAGGARAPLPHDPGRRGPWALSFLMLMWTTFMLLLGANVTSNEAALSVPDWPLAYGTIFPDRWMEIATVRAELVHRFWGAALGIMALVLAIWVQLVEERRWVRRLAWAGGFLVLAQGIVGGVGVLVLQPWFMSVSHATLAQTYFCVLVLLSTALSPWWRNAPSMPLDDAGLGLMRLGVIGTLLLVVHLVLGAMGRHEAIPREVHAMFALPVFIVITKVTLTAAGDVPAALTVLRRRGFLLGALLAGQLALGIWTYLVVQTYDPLTPRTLEEVVPMNLHLVIGAGILATTFSLALRAGRIYGLPTDERVEDARARIDPVPQADPARSTAGSAS